MTKINEPKSQKSGGDRRTRLLRSAMQRFDFLMEIDASQSAGNEIVMQLTPDPRRYDAVLHNGQTTYVDRFTGVGVTLEALVEGFNNNPNLIPAYFLQPRVESSMEYAVNRLGAVRHEIETGEHMPPAEKPVPHRSLDLPQEHPVTFISLDVCGATRLRADDPDGFDKAFGVAFQEFASVVGYFHGSIFKPTGDGFIAYIDHPSVTARDNAVDLGLSLLVVLKGSVNPALVEAGLEPLSIRVGADHGLARMRPLRSLSTGFEQNEVVSDALNRAVKLQEIAEPGTLLIGESLREQLHVDWLERCIEVKAEISDVVGIPNYKCFQVK